MGEEGSDVPEPVRELIADDPFCAFLGIELEALGAGHARTSLRLREVHTNFHGTPHGGVVYSLADAAFAAASNASGETAVALETNVSYLDAADVGETLVATAEETHRGGRTAEHRVDVRTDDDERIATFRGRVYLPG